MKDNLVSNLQAEKLCDLDLIIMKIIVSKQKMIPGWPYMGFSANRSQSNA